MKAATATTTPTLDASELKALAVPVAQRVVSELDDLANIVETLPTAIEEKLRPIYLEWNIEEKIEGPPQPEYPPLFDNMRWKTTRINYTLDRVVRHSSIA